MLSDEEEWGVGQRTLENKEEKSLVVEDRKETLSTELETGESKITKHNLFKYVIIVPNIYITYISHIYLRKTSTNDIFRTICPHVDIWIIFLYITL